MKKRSVKWIVLYCIIGVLFLAGIAMIVRDNVIIAPGYTAPPTQPPATPTPPAPTATPAKDQPVIIYTPEPTPSEPLLPVKIYFTDHEIVCDIEPAGVLESGELEALPSATVAAWTNTSALPGEDGNAILNGHVRWKGKMGHFAILREMEPGEEVVIEFSDGTFRYFTVSTKDVYRLEDFPKEALRADGPARMTLITCLGDYNPDIGTSESRVVVVCHAK